MLHGNYQQIRSNQGIPPASMMALMQPQELGCSFCRVFRGDSHRRRAGLTGPRRAPARPNDPLASLPSQAS